MQEGESSDDKKNHRKLFDLYICFGNGGLRESKFRADRHCQSGDGSMIDKQTET